jgi:hypothetical protein
VIAGAAGIVIVKAADLVVSATEVAVTVIVCAELVATGAVKVAPVAVWCDNVPPLTLHVTPSLFVSFVTVAVRVSVSAASTVVADAVTETVAAALPPQPEMLKAAKNAITKRPTSALILKPDRTDPFRHMSPPGCDSIVCG